MFQKLTLRPKMIDSWLIQRLLPPASTDNPFSFGGGLINGGINEQGMHALRSVFSFDYMGSAEFEWGAVPKALQFLIEQSRASTLIASDIFVRESIGKVFHICPSQYEYDVLDRIIQLSLLNQIKLKEDSGFDPNSKSYHKETVGWLECAAKTVYIR